MPLLSLQAWRKVLNPNLQPLRQKSRPQTVEGKPPNAQSHKCPNIRHFPSNLRQRFSVRQVFSSLILGWQLVSSLSGVMKHEATI
jgi:hypothetical protein